EQGHRNRDRLQGPDRTRGRLRFALGGGSRREGDRSRQPKNGPDRRPFAGRRIADSTRHWLRIDLGPRRQRPRAAHHAVAMRPAASRSGEVRRSGALKAFLDEVVFWTPAWTGFPSLDGPRSTNKKENEAMPDTNADAQRSLRTNAGAGHRRPER